MFVGTKKQARDAVKETAEAADMPYVNHRWLGGLLTNFQTISLRIKRLHDLERYETEGQLELLPTRERMAAQADLAKLRANLGGVKNMQRPPDAVFVIDLKTEAIAVSEAQRLRIPIIGLVDTNCDPEGIDFVIPGNDDAIRSCAAMTRAIGDVVAEGTRRLPRRGGARCGSSASAARPRSAPAARRRSRPVARPRSMARPRPRRGPAPRRRSGASRGRGARAREAAGAQAAAPRRRLSSRCGRACRCTAPAAAAPRARGCGRAGAGRGRGPRRRPRPRPPAEAAAPRRARARRCRAHGPAAGSRAGGARGGGCEPEPAAPERLPSSSPRPSRARGAAGGGGRARHPSPADDGERHHNRHAAEETA